jgi:hypothetical protein
VNNLERNTTREESEVNEPQVCECLHGDLEDDGGNLIMCPGGHDSDGCVAEATVLLSLDWNPPQLADLAHLCRDCADAWMEDDSWIETEETGIISDPVTTTAEG